MNWDGIERRSCAKNDDGDGCPHAIKVSEVHKAVFGNGHPEEGLIWIARENRELIKANSEFIQFVKRHFWKMITWMSVGVVAASGNFIFNLMKNHVGIHIK
jgi:hypothetical protein